MEHLLRDVIEQATEILLKEGIEDAPIDVWLLAESELSITKQKYYMNMRMTIDDEQYIRYMAKVEMRKKRIPLQHITGCQEFMGLMFKVNEYVLIPRQDTELLVEKTIEAVNKLRKVKKNEKIHILDMCTGSGCIAISLAKLCDNVIVTAVDISKEALSVAKENARLNDVEGSITFIKSDLFDKVNEKFDVIVSNPPYIPTQVIMGLEEEVRIHEPMLALDGSEDGLLFYRKITEQADKYLRDDGYVLYEIGYDQGKEVSCLLRNIMPCVKVYKDLAGNDRVVTSGKEEL